MSITQILINTIISAAVIGVVFERWYKTLARRKSLRIALLEELKAPEVGNDEYEPDEYDDLIQQAIDIDGTQINKIATRNVFDSASDDLGLLSEKEVESLVDYYSSLEILEDCMWKKATYETGWKDPPDGIENVIQGTLKNVQKSRKEAIEALEEKLDSKSPL